MWRQQDNAYKVHSANPRHNKFPQDKLLPEPSSKQEVQTEHLSPEEGLLFLAFLRILWNAKQCELELDVFSLSLPNNS